MGMMTSLRVRFVEEGPDRTIDEFTKYPKQALVEGMSAQETILELRQRLSEQEGIPLEDVNLFVRTTGFDDKMLIGNCFVDWMGFGLDDWPPRFICKPRVRGFEVFVDIPRMRDTSIWENGRMQSYMERNLIFDCETSTTILELKEMIAKRVGIPAKRHKLTGHIRKNLRDVGSLVDLDDNTKTLSDYQLDKYCVCVKFEKNQFDENGNFVFDDAYWDADGYHPQPMECWIPQDCIADRNRPDANKIDPNQPLSIVTDRRQAEATAKWEAENPDG